MPADLVLALHAAFVAFVVLGLPVTFIGGGCGWRWIRNAWFRGLHLAAIALVSGLAWLGLPCPLTVWERRAREMQGHGVYPDAFIPYWVHRLLFYDAPPWAFTALYTAFALLVILGWCLWPPLTRRRRARGGCR